MSRRTQRVASVIQKVVGQEVLARLSDPRIDPATVSVTRVEVPEDLLTAKVFVSVMGDETRQRLTLQALRHAKGRLQERVGDQLRLRHTPVLSLQLDEQFKKTLETYALIDRAMEEIRQKESTRDGSDDEGPSASPVSDEPHES
jgi:ribosome-binding factor A